MAKPGLRFLTEGVERALDHLGRLLERSRSDAASVRRVLTALDSLPAEAMPALEHRLPDRLALGYRRNGGPSLRERLLGARSDQELLDDDPNLAWLMLFHRNGYMREAALRALDGPPTSAFRVAALAYRLNDWAPPVRAAAAAAAGTFFPCAPAAAIADAASYLLSSRRNWSRWDDEIAHIDAALSREDVAAAVHGRLAGGLMGPLPSLLRALVRYPSLDRYLPDLFAEAQHPGVRAVALEMLLDGEATWAGEFEQHWIDKSMGKDRWRPRVERRPLPRTVAVAALIRQGLRDRSGAVRRVAMSALIKHATALPDVDELLSQVANDPSWPVRWRAAFLTRERAGG